MERDELSVVRLFRREQPSRTSDMLLASRNQACRKYVEHCSNCTMPLYPSSAGRHSLWVQSGRAQANVCPPSVGPRRETNEAWDSLVHFFKLKEFDQRAVAQSWQDLQLAAIRCI